MDHIGKCKMQNYKTVENNNLSNLGIGCDFSYKTPKTQSMKKKNTNNLDFIKMKKLLL